MNQKRILITGSNGLLGQKLVALLSQNPQVACIATSRGKNRLSQREGYRYYSLDISQAEEVSTAIAELQPHVIINTAAMTQVDTCETEREACWQLNVEAVKHLVEACKAQDIFLVHLSTDFIFDGEKGPYREEDEANPISYYGESKLAAEQYIQASGIRAAIVRTVLVYGIAEAMSRSNIILWVKDSLENGKAIRVVDDQWRSPTLAEDLAQGCWLVAEKEAEGIFNISGEEVLTPYDMAMATVAFFDLDSNLITRTDASEFSQPAKRPPRTGFILDKAKSVLGYQPHSFREGIAILANQIK